MKVIGSREGVGSFTGIVTSPGKPALPSNGGYLHLQGGKKTQDSSEVEQMLKIQYDIKIPSQTYSILFMRCSFELSKWNLVTRGFGVESGESTHVHLHN